MTDGPLRALARILANADEGGGNRRLRLEVEGWPGFAPGQFLMLSPGACGDVPRLDPLLPRPMAVYRDDGSAVDVLYKVTGRGTGLLADARPGERVQVVGPLGRPFPEPDADERAVLVGGGTGVASLFELAVRCARRGPVQVLLGARSAGDLMGRADFESAGLDLQLATEDGSAGRRGLVTDLLSDALADGGRVYACGPTPMMERAAQVAESHGCRALVSLENPMACGFGVCLGCAVPLRGGRFGLVCRDGPVFAADEVEWGKLA